jgi:hypothetical protein
MLATCICLLWNFIVYLYIVYLLLNDVFHKLFYIQSVFTALRGTAAHYSSDALLHTCTTSAYPRELHLHDVSIPETAAPARRQHTRDGCTCTTSAETAAAPALRQRRRLLHLHYVSGDGCCACTLHTCIMTSAARCKPAYQHTYL